MTNPTNPANGQPAKTPRAMLALVALTDNLPMPEHLAFQGEASGEPGVSIMSLIFRTLAEGQAWSRHLGGGTNTRINSRDGRVYLDAGRIVWHGWSMHLHASDDPNPNPCGPLDADTAARLTAITNGRDGQDIPEHECWSGFCIASFCDGVNHVDATGYSWVEAQPRRGDRS